MGHMRCHFKEDDMVDYILDDIADAMDEDGRLDETAMEELAELGALADDPLDINSATAEELSQLIFLSDNKIRSIISHRQMVGKIRSVQELTTIRGLTYGDIFKMRHFVYIGEGTDTATIRKNLKIEALGRIGRRWPESRVYRQRHHGCPIRWRALGTIGESEGRSRESRRVRHSGGERRRRAANERWRRACGLRRMVSEHDTQERRCEESRRRALPLAPRARAWRVDGLRA